MSKKLIEKLSTVMNSDGINPEALKELQRLKDIILGL